MNFVKDSSLKFFSGEMTLFRENIFCDCVIFEIIMQKLIIKYFVNYISFLNCDSSVMKHKNMFWVARNKTGIRVIT